MSPPLLFAIVSANACRRELNGPQELNGGVGGAGVPAPVHVGEAPSEPGEERPGPGWPPAGAAGLRDRERDCPRPGIANTDVDRSLLSLKYTLLSCLCELEPLEQMDAMAAITGSNRVKAE